MHYKDGRKAKVGDQVLVDNQYDGKYVGMVVSITAEATTCNAIVAPLPIQEKRHVTLGEVLHINDALGYASLAPDVEGIAGQLYETYCRAVGGVAFNGDPLPTWKEFRADPSKQKQSDAWIAVANESLK